MTTPTYHRSGNKFFKVLDNEIMQVILKDDSACIDKVTALPEGATEIDEKKYLDAVSSAMVFGCIGGHPDIPPSE